MSRPLRSVFNYAKAPLSQWEPAIGDTPSEGKQQEDALIYPRIASILSQGSAKTMTGIIADEARLEIYLSRSGKLGAMTALTHLTLDGAFARAAKHNVENAKTNKVSVTTDADAIAPNSQDAVVLNMILGCVSTQKDHGNLGALVQLAASYVNEKGSLILVRPNPEGQDFSTYACVTPANDLKGGKDYEFIVKGLEDLGPMKNLHTPDDFMKPVLERAGLRMGTTQPVTDKKNGQTPFLLNVCRPR